MPIALFLRIFLLVALYCSHALGMRTRQVYQNSANQRLLAGAKENDIEKVVAALREAANPNYFEISTAHETVSALHYAMLHKNLNLMQLLLTSGAVMSLATLPLLFGRLEALTREEDLTNIYQ